MLKKHFMEFKNIYLKLMITFFFSNFDKEVISIIYLFKERWEEIYIIIYKIPINYINLLKGNNNHINYFLLELALLITWTTLL